MKLLNKIFLLFVVGFLCNSQLLEAQVGINILQPDTSAILHLESTDRGFLPPRMTTAQRDNIFSPKPGLTVFNTEDSTLQYFTGRCWLPVWQQNCDECLFDFTIENSTGNIDRIVANTDSTRLFINQTNGTTSVGIYIIANLPDGITATIDSSVVTGSDTVNLVVEANIFAPPGTYPIVVQAACDGTIKSQVFVVTVDPCIEIDLIAPQVNYDLQAANNLPTNTPICVVLRIPPGLELTNDTTGPAVDALAPLLPRLRNVLGGTHLRGLFTLFVGKRHEARAVLHEDRSRKLRHRMTDRIDQRRFVGTLDQGLCEVRGLHHRILQVRLQPFEHLEIHRRMLEAGEKAQIDDLADDRGHVGVGNR